MDLPAIALKRRIRRPLTIWTRGIWTDTVYRYGVPRNRLTKALTLPLMIYNANNQ